MTRVVIVGVGETEYVRRSDKSIKTLVLQAVCRALDDCSIDASEVDGIVSEAGIMPYVMPADEVAANLGISRSFTAQASVGGAGTVASMQLAADAISSGWTHVVVCYFGVDWGSSDGGPYEFHTRDRYKDSLEFPIGWYGQPAYISPILRRYQHEYGLRSEQLGALAIATRSHALMNPAAQERRPFTLSDYLASPMIADPLRLFDCCLRTDGAAAFVMTSEERARGCPTHPIYIAGVGFAASALSASSYLTQNPDYLSTPAKDSAPRALARAGLSLSDVQFAEIYDCFTISCLIQMEDIGFCRRGEAGEFVEGGRTGPGGEFPVNTHGGLLSHAYMLGINHVVEALCQLRYEARPLQVPGAEVVLVAGWGCWEHATAILTSNRL